MPEPCSYWQPRPSVSPWVTSEGGFGQKAGQGCPAGRLSWQERPTPSRSGRTLPFGGAQGPPENNSPDELEVEDVGGLAAFDEADRALERLLALGGQARVDGDRRAQHLRAIGALGEAR